MINGKTLLLIVMAVAVLSHKSDGQPPATVEQQLRLARLMPAGASLYVQARDLSALMTRWLASPARTQFYDSPSFKAFSRSRIYLKLADRIKDFEAAIGIGLNEGRLAELAGGPSAVAVYDIGRTELLFVSELPRERVLATALFKRIPQLQERTAEGENYYVADVTTDGGKLKQQFCFAHTGGRLLVTSAEALMLRALRNAKGNSSDTLLPVVLANTSQARGFAAHDLTMWIDQSRLNENRYFRNNWVHRNARELSNIQAGLVDLRFTRQGLSEQRWFALKESQPSTEALDPARAAALARFAPRDAQLILVHGAAAERPLDQALVKTLLGELRQSAPASDLPPDRTRWTAGASGAGARRERYSRLDSRFDSDVDDEQSPIRPSPQSAEPLTKQTPALLLDVVKSVSPRAFCEIARSRTDAEKLFVSFDRAVVIEMKEGASIDRTGLERAVTEQLQSRFVVQGVQPRLEWQSEGVVRYLAQPLVQRVAAYAVSGRYLVLGSSKDFVAEAIAASTTPPAGAAALNRPAEFYAIARVSEAKPLFDKLMLALDGPAPAGPDGVEEREVKFFSENLSSLISTLAVRELRVRRATESSMLFEEVLYLW